jgi:hypothetical protein
MTGRMTEGKNGSGQPVEQHHVLGQQESKVLQLQIVVADAGRCRP